MSNFTVTTSVPAKPIKVASPGWTERISVEEAQNLVESLTKAIVQAINPYPGPVADIEVIEVPEVEPIDVELLGVRDGDTVWVRARVVNVDTYDKDVPLQVVPVPAEGYESDAEAAVWVAATSVRAS